MITEADDFEVARFAAALVRFKLGVIAGLAGSQSCWTKVAPNCLQAAGLARDLANDLEGLAAQAAASFKHMKKDQEGDSRE